MNRKVKTRLLLFATFLFFFISNTQITFAQGADNEHRTYPQISLPESMRGERAIRALEKHLPEIAAWHHMSVDKLKEHLRKDLTLWADKKGRLFFRDEHELPLETPSGMGETAAGTPVSLEDTFYLHSNPKATRIIYLDFNGHLIPGNSVWGNGYNGGQDIVCPAWDIDGNPQVFNAAELERIQYIWQRVAEDYTGFDVDVTTEELSETFITRSSSSDEYYGMRVLISPISSYVGNYGGYAYIGIFNRTGDYYKPALVFPEKLANGEKYIAECISHEVGHTLGLYHDGKTDGTTYYSGHGSGEIGWAPIMGIGYYKNLVQWSKGEYALASNQADDLARILIFGGFDYLQDDHGNDLLSATWITNQGGSISGEGIIEQNTDVDIFALIAGQGEMSINIMPDLLAPNLDIKAAIYDQDGALVTSGNPLLELKANIAATVDEGVYYLSIEGTGNQNVSDYGSLGKYTITGTVVSSGNPLPPVARIEASPMSGRAQLLVQFSGEASYDPDGTIVSYLWDFADGAFSNAINPLHTFSNVRSYSVRLTVTDNDGSSDASTVHIDVLAPNVIPVASIQATPTQGYAPLTVQFDGSSSYDNDGSITNYSWVLGDDAQKNGVAINHTYEAPGIYSVELTVTDNDNATAKDTIIITVTENPSIIADPTNLSGSSNGNNITLGWQDKSHNEEGFTIERGIKKKGNITYTPIANVGVDVTSYLDSELANGTYRYRVRAFNLTTGFESGYSNETQASIGKGGRGNKGKKPPKK
ncbi:MAG: PKD domain-containing protein [Omnitrophica bacterium]|nr:PKD domain-containing protein [Candidatus Omnitrophota bacterium]